MLDDVASNICQAGNEGSNTLDDVASNIFQALTSRRRSVTPRGRRRRRRRWPVASLPERYLEMGIDMEYGLPIWDMVYRYAHPPYVILDIDIGYLVTLPSAPDLVRYGHLMFLSL